MAYYYYTVLVFVIVVSQASREAASVGAQDVVPQGSLLASRERLLTERGDDDDDDDDEGECTNLWFVRSQNNSCTCGARVDGAVSCDSSTGKVSVLDCYCMTEDSSSHQMVVGTCIFNCVNLSKTVNYDDFIYHPAPSLCEGLHRDGTLCGGCAYKDGYFPPAYSFSLQCSKCSKPQSVWLYITAAFLPLTGFIVLIQAFRISALYPPLHAFICFSQIVGAPIQARVLLQSTKYIGGAFSIMTKVCLAIFGVWNLDFFRSLIPGICMHLTTIEVLSLDYVIAVYPMVLMVTLYILTELHAHGVRPIVFLWRPFHYLSARFRRNWDIQTSLIDAFATFFLLSSTKLFSVSFDLLIPTTLYLKNGDNLGMYLFYDPNLKYMSRGSGHLYYGILALSVLVIFFVLPLAFVVFSNWKCLSGARQIRVVKELLQTMQKYYKDGSEEGTRDCRWYAGYHHISLFGIYIVYTVTVTEYAYVLGSLYYVMAAMVVIILEPYKEEYWKYNILDVVLFLWQALFGASISVLNFSGYFQRQFMYIAYLFIVVIGTTPILAFLIMVLWYLLRVMGCRKKCCRSELERQTSLAHRITNSEEYKDGCGYVTLRQDNSLESNTVYTPSVQTLD